MDYVTLSLSFGRDETEFFGGDADIHVGYEFTPGRPATRFDPPEPAEVNILEIEKIDGTFVNVNDVPEKLYNTLVDMIINIEEEFNTF